MVVLDSSVALVRDEDSGDRDLVSEFSQRWSLKEDAQQLLASLSPEAQNKVITEFAPRDTSRDCNAIFFKFAQGISRGFPKAQSFGNPQGQVRTITAAPSVNAAVAQQPAVQRSDEEMEAFVARWALGLEAQQLLWSLDHFARQRVMQEFSPRDTSTDVNAIFLKFAHGVASGKPRLTHGGWNAIAPAPPVGIYAAPPVQVPQIRAPVTYVAPQWQSQQMVPAQPPLQDASLQQFIARWNLSAESQARLFGLAPHVREKVMLEFSPRDTSRDANAIFQKFTNGVEQAYGALRDPHAEQVQTFMTQWNLAFEAQTIMEGLSREQQVRVMQEFAPRDASRDANAIFIRFARGVASGSSKGMGKGRPFGVKSGGAYTIRAAPY